MLDEFRKKFQEKLQLKTGWGRVELLTIVDNIITELKYKYPNIADEQPPWGTTKDLTVIPDRVIIQIKEEGGLISKLNVSLNKVIKIEHEQVVTIDGYDYDITKECSDELDKMFFSILH